MFPFEKINSRFFSPQKPNVILNFSWLSNSHDPLPSLPPSEINFIYKPLW